jgi:hypothetical protein
MTKWFTQRDDSTGQLLCLARIRDEGGGLHPEIWTSSGWQENAFVMSFLVDPLAADEIDEAGAERALREFDRPLEG